MSHGTLIAITFGLTIAATLGLMGWSFAAMRSAERRADALRREP